MTTQAMEFVIWDGVEYVMEECPLDSWFELTGRRPKFGPAPTAMKRGYWAAWAIENNRLFLTSVDGYLLGGVELTLAHLFPEQSGPVPCDWFSGTLHLPHGKRRLDDYFFVWERVWTLTVESGVVTRSVDSANPNWR